MRSVRKTITVTASGSTMRQRIGDLLRDICRNWRSYVFLAPFLLVFSVITVFPLIMSAYYSLTSFNGLQAPRWLGFANFETLFLDDRVFPLAMRNTLTFAIIAGPVGYLLSFILAWLLNNISKRLRMGYALAYYSPSIAGAAVAAAIWTPLFSPDRSGYLNSILLRIGIIHEPIAWTLDPKYLLATLIVQQLWMSMGTGFLVFLAGFQHIPLELYEAGRVDGIKSKWHELLKITIPMMKPQMLFSAVMSVVSSFNVAGVVAQAGYAGHTIVSHMNDFAFTRYEMGYASAVSVILFLITIGLNRVLFAVFSSEDE